MKITLGFFSVYLIWGTSYLAIKMGVESFPPIFFCAARYLIAAPLLFLVVHLRGEKLPTTPAEFFWLILTAIMVLVIPGGLIAWGQRLIDSQIAALLMSSTSLWICLFASTGSHGEKITLPVFAGLLTGMASLAFITDFDLEQGINPGHIAVLMAAIFFSLGTLTFRKYVPSHQPAVSACIHLFIAGSIMMVASLTFEPAPGWQPLSTAALFYTAIANSVFALLIYYWLVHTAAPAMIGTPNMVVPMIAMVSGALFSNEVLSQARIFGALLMLLALALIIAPTSLRLKNRITN